MKKVPTFFTLLFLLCQLINAQCPNGDCIEADMNFEPDSSFISNADWQASHGSPSVNPGTAWMWSYNSRGEGINYHSYNFVKGRQYCITFTAKTVVRGGGLAHPDAFFKVVATQGDVIGAVTGSGGGPIPATPSPNQLIANENWNATSPPSTTVYTYTFTATDNFDNLWFYPFSPSLPVVELSLHKLIICDITPPPCKANFKLELNEMGSGNTAISILPQTVPAGASTQLQIYKNGSLVYSGLPISYIATPANYTICMTVILRDGTKCQKCFDFCIGKWSERPPRTTLPSEVQSSKRKADKVLNFPDALKEKNLPSAQEEESIRIAPNPSDGIFSITSTMNTPIQQIEVFSLPSGALLKVLDSTKSKHGVLDLSKHKEGVYFINITLNNGNVVSKKLIIKR
ncbi:T9SS type A sorting domain-containing protein [Aquimarina hainanensis]|uniref:T9SS type A sorting domain-containing protein n=1 Tax=Aquimarina hainanensis TaxID=1578017 RepID=A0ABW5NF14_9FLAO